MKVKYPTLLALLTLAFPVFAHHPLAGAPMQTFTQGLISGVGHPIIGFDHLFFVIAVGIAAVFTSRRLMTPLFFIVGMLGGVGLILAGVQLPSVEVVIALSLVSLGGIVLAGKSLSFHTAATLFTVLGIFHGWAYGETLIGQESLIPSVVIAYLIGLAVSQWMIAIAAGYVVSNIWHSQSSNAIKPRLAGAVVTGVGITFTLEIAENILFATV